MLPSRILGLLVLLLAVQVVRTSVTPAWAQTERPATKTSDKCHVTELVCLPSARRKSTGLCKPTKSTEELDYEDDTPFDEEDEEDEEEETDSTDTDEPQILSHGMSVRVKAGSIVVLPCEVVHTENYAVAWKKDDSYLYLDEQAYTNDKRFVRLPNNSLAIYNASLMDSSDNYKCSILRNPDSIDLIHRLLVDQKPLTSEISLSPPPPPPQQHKGIIRVIPSKKIDVNQGHSIRLGCETDVQPPPEIKWFIENKKVEGYDSDIILDGNYIVISRVNESHAGLYQCLAEDGSKTPAMEAIHVVVHYKPKIEVDRSIVYSGTGAESELTCIVSAYPDASVTWYKNDKKLTQKKGSILIHHGIVPKGKKHVLTIMRTSAKDFGEYRCHAQNTIGADIKSIVLTGIPSKPIITGAEITDDETGIILKWRLESYSPIDEYKLQYRRNGEEWILALPEVKDGKGNQFSVEYPIRKLQPGSYEVILKARNAYGWSLDSEPHTFTGDYPPDLALKGNSATIRSPEILLALLLVIVSFRFISFTITITGITS